MIKYEYRILSFYNDKYGMEDSLNELAEEGWRLVSTCLQHPDSSKSTIIVILEKIK
jgi:hypothetical protein